MRKLLRYCGFAVLVSVALGAALADVVVTSSSPAWLLLPNSIGNGGAGTWGLPADLTSIGCGTENEPTCEPTGIFNINSLFTATGAVHFDSTAGVLSDLIVWDNSGPGGLGQIRFYSDPNLPAGVGTGTLLCTENTGGCVQSMDLLTTNGTTLTVGMASDGESVFDPFGYGFDTSDQIKFSGTGVTVSNVPEPSAVLLLASCLGALVIGIRRKAQA